MELNESPQEVSKHKCPGLFGPLPVGFQVVGGFGIGSSTVTPNDRRSARDPHALCRSPPLGPFEIGKN